MTLIIAEAGVNHNGEIDNAIALVDAAVDAGVDVVKFQTFNADKLVTRSAPKAGYQIDNTGSMESQYQMLKALELSESEHYLLAQHCKTKKIEFLSTAFDQERLDFLVQNFNLSRLKIPSGDLTNHPFLLHHARQGLPIILSTGMSTLDEIDSALSVIAFGYLSQAETLMSSHQFQQARDSKEGSQLLKEKVTLLHCTSQYPTPISDVNLNAMDTLKETFGLEVGYSDHTMGIHISLAAVARGARVIEKHFTLDRDLPGPDHAASLEADELTLMTKCIRDIEQSFGSHSKEPTQIELDTRVAARKSLVAAVDIDIGAEFTAENCAIMRPGNGMAPNKYWALIGSNASRNYQEGDLIDE